MEEFLNKLWHVIQKNDPKKNLNPPDGQSDFLMPDSVNLAGCFFGRRSTQADFNSTNVSQNPPPCPRLSIVRPGSGRWKHTEIQQIAWWKVGPKSPVISRGGITPRISRENNPSETHLI